MATIVGFFHMPAFQIVCRNSEDSSPIQSITTRSVLPLVISANALEELRQRFVEIESWLSKRSITLNTPGSRETNKHSNAMSDVKATLAQEGSQSWTSN